jgi:hypothetical protein
MTRIKSIHFDRKGRLKRSVISTSHGIVKAEWMDCCGEWSWFTTGTGNAKIEAVPFIEKIEELLIDFHTQD